MTAPIVDDDPAYQLLRQERVDLFNEQKDTLDLGGLAAKDYRGIDLRNLNADGLDFSDSYFRNADLRGIDFRKAKLEGSSFADAKISGCYFDDGLSASEMAMSIVQGTRVRRDSAADK